MACLPESLKFLGGVQSPFLGYVEATILGHKAASLSNPSVGIAQWTVFLS